MVAAVAHTATASKHACCSTVRAPTSGARFRLFTTRNRGGYAATASGMCTRRGSRGGRHTIGTGTGAWLAARCRRSGTTRALAAATSHPGCRHTLRAAAATCLGVVGRRHRDAAGAPTTTLANFPSC